MAEPARPREFSPTGFFVFRTSLLPFDEVLDWAEGTRAAEALDDDRELETALRLDRERLRERLRGLYDRPAISEALFLASPSLHERMGAWLRDPEGKKGERIELALVRYFVRMASRATPFGLCAGCSVGELGRATRLETAALDHYKRHTRLDMDYLCSLADKVEQEPEARRALSYRPNSSLYRVAGRVRYAEGRPASWGRSYRLVNVESTDYLERTLERASEGARLADLARGLVADDPEVEMEEAEAYVDELVGSQILVSDLAPAVTGPEPVHELIDRLERLPGAADIARRLDRARSDLAEIDASGVGVAPERYVSLARELSGLPVEVQPSKWLQVDMIKPAPGASLGPEVVAEIYRAVTILGRLAFPLHEDPLASFRRAFLERYDAEAVPLVEVLDAEAGIGFEMAERSEAGAAPLLDGILVPDPIVRPVVPWEKFHVLLLNKLIDAQASPDPRITIEEAELEGIWSASPRSLPVAFELAVTLAASSEQAVAEGDFRLLVRGGAGPSGARLLGRFCHVDERMHEQVLRHLEHEEALVPDAVFAEIAHLPEDRLGNVLSRPVLRSHEIPYLGRSGAPPDRQIPVTDLWVSVRGDRVVLTSRRLRREVLPRLTTAHNFIGRALPIYRFLCMLQAQNTVFGLGWQWAPFEGASFLPRVVCGRLVLSRARWNLKAAEIRDLVKKNGAARFRAVQELRERKRMPRFVYLVDGDNELLVDFENVLCIETLIDAIEHREGATLGEMFPGPEELAARGPEGRFVQELLVPFVRAEASSRPTLAGSAEPQATAVQVPRRLLPGSDWVYAKLYCGTATADQLLRQPVRALVESLEQGGAIDRWFFVRYRDPDSHLRLRFQGDPARLREEVVPRIHATAAELERDGLIWKLQLETYEREIGRYGGPEGMLLSESLFHIDSQAVLALLDSISGDDAGSARWRLTLVGMDRLLRDLRLTFAERRRVLRECRDAFRTEFRVEKGTRIALGNRFRKERDELDSLLESAVDVFDRRSSRLEPVVAELRERERSGALHLDVPRLAGSYLHLFANRVLRSAHRKQEVVLYDFLDRLYESRAAREQVGA